MNSKKKHKHSKTHGAQTHADQPGHDPLSTNHEKPTPATQQDTPAKATPKHLLESEDVLAHDQGYLVVGKIGRAHGLQGMLFVHSFTDPKENLFRYDSLLLGNKQRIYFSRYQNHAQHIIAQIAGMNDPDQAKSMTNKLLYLHTDNLPALPEGQYYWHQLTDCRVVNQQGVDFGRVGYIYAGAQFPLMVIKHPENPKKPETLIPYDSSVVRSVSLPEQTIIVDWILDE